MLPMTAKLTLLNKDDINGVGMIQYYEGRLLKLAITVLISYRRKICN